MDEGGRTQLDESQQQHEEHERGHRYGRNAVLGFPQVRNQVVDVQCYGQEEHRNQHHDALHEEKRNTSSVLIPVEADHEHLLEPVSVANGGRTIAGMMTSGWS